MSVFTLRVVGAAVELSIFPGTENQGAAASWASAGSNRIVFLLPGATDVLQMLLIGLLAGLHLRRLDGIAYLINLGPGEPLLLDVSGNFASAEIGSFSFGRNRQY